MPSKALVLLSGGLDSMLAAKLLLEQGIEVIGVSFESDFFGAAKARTAAAELGIELEVIDIGKDMLALVKNPPSGYGKSLNPCIDCHALMIRRAGKLAEDRNCVFIATGEVLGQRPFSQNASALKRVEKLAGREILRPLSAKLLPETSAERNGLVRRGPLKNISGRSREAQLDLAQKYGLKGYSPPAGGCLLTDPEFSQRLLKLLEYKPLSDRNDVSLLKYGRIFWLKRKTGEDSDSAPNISVLVGRCRSDNDNLVRLAKPGDFMLELIQENGPTTLIRGLADNNRFVHELRITIPKKLELSRLRLSENKNFNEVIELVALLTGYYAVKARGREAVVAIKKL